MPKKKSIETSARKYIEELEKVEQFLDIEKDFRLSEKEYAEWIYELGLIKVYRAFEGLMLECLVGALNNDTNLLSSHTGISFPKDLSKAVCEYLVVGSGYFNFRGGRDGLLKELQKFLPADHYLVDIVKNKVDKDILDRLVAFRNYAVHSSEVAKNKAKKIAQVRKISEAGKWMRTQGRLKEIISKLKELANNIKDAAPY